MKAGELRSALGRSDEEPHAEVVSGEELRERTGRPEPGPLRADDGSGSRELAERFVDEQKARSRGPIQETGPVPEVALGVTRLGDDGDLRRTGDVRQTKTRDSSRVEEGRVFGWAEAARPSGFPLAEARDERYRQGVRLARPGSEKHPTCVHGEVVGEPLSQLPLVGGSNLRGRRNRRRDRSVHPALGEGVATLGMAIDPLAEREGHRWPLVGVA